MRGYLVLLICAVTVTGCAWLQALARSVSDVAADPGVQDAATGVAANALAGNWLGAAVQLVELLAMAAGVYKATNMRRDAMRRKRGEPTGKNAGGAVSTGAPPAAAG